MFLTFFLPTLASDVDATKLTVMGTITPAGATQMAPNVVAVYPGVGTVGDTWTADAGLVAGSGPEAGTIGSDENPGIYIVANSGAATKTVRVFFWENLSGGTVDPTKIYVDGVPGTTLGATGTDRQDVTNPAWPTNIDGHVVTADAGFLAGSSPPSPAYGPVVSPTT